MIALPGLIDAHVHLRTPGQTHKEDLDTGTCAAIAGGFTHVLDMPNTTPPISNEHTLKAKLVSIREHAHCDVSQFLGASPTNVETAHTLSKRVVGLKIYLGETHGPLILYDPATAIAHMRRWPGHVAVHAEGWQLVAAIGIARLLNRHVHCCHVARRTDILFIRQAKESGAPITCEVTPHHLWLTDEDATRLHAMGYMKPTLGTAADRQALWEHMEVVDCVASDHAPHTRMEKDGSTPPPGVPGLETTLPLMLTAVHEGRLTMDRLVELLYHGPRRVYGLPEQPETEIKVAPDETYVLGKDPLYTKCDWTPFAGQRVYGRLHQVTLRGKTVYQDHQVNVELNSHLQEAR